MKTFKFTIFGHTITLAYKKVIGQKLTGMAWDRWTFNFGKKPEEKSAKEEIKMEDKEHNISHLVHPDQWASTVNEPDIPYDKTFYGCCIDYIESQRGKLADSTLRGYRNICDNHLDSIMGLCTIDIITEGLIQKAFNEEIAKGLSEKTLKGYRSFVLKVLVECRPDLKPEIRIVPWEAKPQWSIQKEEVQE